MDKKENDSRFDNLNNDTDLSDVSLLDFDLSEFEDEIKRQQEETERERRLEIARIKEEEHQRAVMLAQKAAEEKEARRKEEEARRAARLQAEKEKRERELAEAQKAAELAAEAAVAAKKAEEARMKAADETSAIMRHIAQKDPSIEQSSVMSEVKVNLPPPPQALFATEEGAAETPAAEEKSAADKTKEIILKANNSNLNSAPVSDDNDEEQFNSLTRAEERENKSHPFGAVLIIILIIAIVAALGYVGYQFFIKQKYSPPEKTDAAIVSMNTPYASLKTNFKKAEYPENIRDDMKAMYSQNKDLAGWLSIPGISIDYPVVQAKDNNYYIKNNNAFSHDAYYGAPFLDYRCSKSQLDKNTIVYGHHMYNDMHFASLDGYMKSSFAKSHPVIYYKTLNESYKFKVYAAFYATTQGSVDGGYVFEYYNPNMSNSNFRGYISMLNQYALYTTDAGLISSDKIITLSTCTHVYDNLRAGGVDSRFVVVGRLFRSNEADEISTVKDNPDYRRPQLWYDKNKKTNPFASYRLWMPSI